MTESKKYIYKSNFLTGVKPNQAVIYKKCFLTHVPGITEEELEPSAVPEEWYPFVNSYYPFTEDVDAFARVHHLLEEKRSSDSLEKIDPQTQVNEYSERKAQWQYLYNKPTSFLILGKPGIGEEDLGRRLADDWNCVYIDPLTLLEEEIASERRPGQCIEFNLRCGRAVGVDVLIRLLARKFQSSSVLHTGCVCAGFPLIPNDLFEDDPISSESAIFNVREIFDEILDQTLRIVDTSVKVAVSMVGSSKQGDISEVEEKEIDSERTLGEGDVKISLDWENIENQVCGPTDISTDLEKQLSCLFGLFDNPFMIIYIYSKNSDVLTKRDNYYYDIYSRRELDMLKIKLFYEIGSLSDDLTEELFYKGNNPFADNPSLKHIVKFPKNFSANVSTQLDRYHSAIANILDSHVLQHETQYYIKLDGRSFISQMMKLIKLRLHVLPLQPVLIPQRFSHIFYDNIAEDMEPDDMREVTVEEAFLKFSKERIISPMFKWVWSDWYTFCPVSMTRGIYTKGSPKFAVHFLNKIYFLSDEKSCLKFINNPRRYLSPPYPKSGSNLLVFGPPVSGKTAVSKCLGYLLNSKVLRLDEMHTEYFSEVMEEYKEQVKQVALAEAMEMLKEKYLNEMKEKEEERNNKILSWEEQSLSLLKKLSEIFELFDIKSVEKLSSFPVKIKRGGIEDIRSVDEETIIRETLVFLNFPDILDKERCNKLIEDRDALYEYLPDNLKAEVVLPTPSALDPFVLNYANAKVGAIQPEDVKKEMGDLYEMYARGIRTVEEQSDYDGWIIDGMTTDLNVVKQICGDFSVYDIIILTAADFNFLLERFRQGDKRITEFNDFRIFFLNNGEKDAAWRAPSTASTESYKKKMATDLLDEIFTANIEPETVQSNRELFAQKYEEELTVYKEEIVVVQEFFDSYGIRPLYLDVQDLAVEDLLKEVVNALQDKYRRQASEFTDADRAEEIQQFLSHTPRSEVEAGVQDSNDLIARNRRYGDTSFYCPVTFTNKFVLWRGKEQFAAKFEDKIYLMCNETSLRDFIRSPRKYLLQNEPPKVFPPPRICVIGPSEEIRTQAARQLAKNLGVRYLHFKSLKEHAVNAFSSTALFLDQEERELPDALIYAWYDILFSKLWFDENILKYIGFVLDGFPEKQRCLDYMIFHCAIPDMIICIGMSWDEYLSNELEKLLRNWRELKEEQRREEEIINSMVLSEWEAKRKARYNELIEIKRENRYSQEISRQDEEIIRTIEEEPNETSFISDTQISVDSVIEQQEHDEAMKILDEELPEPVLQITDETEEQATEKFTVEIELKYNKFMEHYQKMKDICDIELIPLTEINGSQEIGKIVRRSFIAGNEIKFRGPSFFERCYDVSVDTAEKLLASGYYLMSFFGRFCPVQYHNGDNLLHMCIANEEKNNIYPVIHRQYIYFIGGKHIRDKFFNNPLKYTMQKRFDLPLIPLRVAIIGPPKSGKTSLSNRFKRDFGFRVISRGEAIRYTLSHPLFKNLHNVLEELLRKGVELGDELVAECVYAGSFCGESVTQGLVFDGFPNTVTEMNTLCRFGLVPHLIFDLQISEQQIFEQATNSTYKDFTYSSRFIEHFYKEWQKDKELFRTWCDREYQNIYKLQVDRSIWGVWDHAKKVTLAAVFERKHYYRHAKMDWPLRLGYMLVTPLEFLERQSGYKTYCPGCLFHSRKLTNGGDPPDRTGLVQYGKYFYWLCEEHIEDFLEKPHNFLPPSNVTLPQDLPIVVELKEEPTDTVEEGYCLVCYRQNFPKKVLVKGQIDYAVSYRGQIFLFDNCDCMKWFLTTPEELSHLTINYKESSLTGSVNYGELPVLGMLEQYVARTVVRAVNHANVHRPIIPGLSISQAALVCVGLNLKVHNPNTAYRDKYEQALQTFHQRRLNLIKYLDMMKKYLNPTVHYEEPDTPSSTEVEEDEILPSTYSSVI